MVTPPSGLRRDWERAVASCARARVFSQGARQRVRARRGGAPGWEEAGRLVGWGLWAVRSAWWTR